MEKELFPKVAALVFKSVGDARDEIFEVPQEDEFALTASIGLGFIAVESVEEESDFSHVL